HQIASHGVVEYRCRCGIVVDLQVTPHCVARAHRSRPDLDWCRAVLVHQIAPDVHAANLILSRTGWEVLDLQVTVNAGGTIKRERATALDLYVAADGGADQDKVAASLGDVPGHPAIHESTRLPRGDR